MSKKKCLEPALYIVSTPIGNKGDISARAIETLKQVSLIAAEDTRHSGHLLQHFNIDTPQCSYHDHSKASVCENLLQKIINGHAVALISDAGTPLISDPGYRLVDEAVKRGVRVVPVVGPSAVIAALSASGLPSDRFSFEGFLPAKSAARKRFMENLIDQSQTLIFYESPRRLDAALTDMVEVFGAARIAVIARELTKAFETIKRDSLGGLLSWVRSDANQQKGECVILVKGAEISHELDAKAQRVADLLASELSIKKAAAIASEITGVGKNALYEYLLRVKA